jgi:glycyl-tRNA synthetase
MLTFQRLIQKLLAFWEKEGCLIHQGHDLEVGAGTFNPATFLRCLGPEPYSTVYVEPSRRPADGRFGQNPNRLQLFHQLQVVIKPPPADIQASYLRSLEAMGLKLHEHDIRFVHDDWESPTLGAWGLGWEVWCDGMEISQFTYFQAMGSLPLQPTCAEITYGLERLCMFLQNVPRILDIQWDDTHTLGDVSRQSEIEWSTYNFREAEVALWRRHFDDFEGEAQRLIAVRLPLPAYDFVIKASHAFNMLDARGALSTTERTGYITRIRDLARSVAGEYIVSREKAGFPLCVPEQEKKPPKVRKVSKKFDPEKRSPLLLEIGSEELPATFIPVGMQSFERLVRQLLERHGLSFTSVEAFGSPRRLSIRVEGLIEGSAPKSVEKRGPPLSIALEGETWTSQGEGFFRSLEISPVSPARLRKGKVRGVEIRRIKEADYLFATLEQPGVSTAQIIAQHLPALIGAIEFPKKMRWSDLDVAYARPVHWIVALLGSEVIPFTFGDIASHRITFGHVQRGNKKISLGTPDDYLPLLKDHFVLARPTDRKASIVQQLRNIEATTQTKALREEEVLREVVYLTEWPELLPGSFDAKYLGAPAELLASEMVSHQRYFPLATSEGELKNLFVITADNTPSELIRTGNEKVLSARLADGAFLYEEDLKTPFDTWNEKLGEVTLQKELGTLLDKVSRLGFHVHVVNEQISLADQRNIERAALLSKADLVSSCVREFPELQGVMGKYYALATGEPMEVALALEEQWLPRGEGGAVPKTPTGIVLSLADKIDNLLGYFAVGLKPTSSADPYALRRQASGLVRILLHHHLSVDLRELLTKCSARLPVMTPEVVPEVLKFITARSKKIFEENGLAPDEIQASIGELCTDPYDQLCRIRALAEFRKTPAFHALYEVYKRAKGQLGERPTTPFSLHLATEKAEKALAHQLDLLGETWDSLLREGNYAHAYQNIAKLQPFITDLFETVKILADDPKVRSNRLALLHRVFDLFEELLDFSKITIL